MKILNLSCLLFLLPCFCFSQKGIYNYWEITVDTTEPKLNFKKEIRFTHPNQQYQKVIRNYFGVQRNLKSTFEENNAKKYPILNTFKKYPIASFFAEGVYELSPEKILDATKIFRPILDSIFSNTSQDSVLHAEIVVMGYTNDEMPSNSFQFEVVGTKVNKPIQDDKSYKLAISYLRAKALGELIQELIEKNRYEFNNFDKVLLDVIMIGRGSELPEIGREYKPNDERRRIAKLYWKIL